MYDPHEGPDIEEQAYYWTRQLQSLVQYCYNCQPYENGEIAVWVLGTRTDLSGFFDDEDVPENDELRAEIADQLHCLNCGTEGFEVETEVGIKGALERALDERFAQASGAYGNKIRTFQQLLERTPTLGPVHELGKEILDALLTGKIRSCTAAGRFYRGRLGDGSRVLGPEDLDAPPLGVASDARFNHAGQRVLYLASTEEVAIAESMGDLKSALVWIQEFELQRVDHLLDLTVEDDEYLDSELLLVALLESEALMRPVFRDSKWKPDYFLPRFVADCARHAGYRGIRYPSVRSFGDNIVLFDHDSVKTKLRTVGEPKPVIHKPPCDPFAGEVPDL